MIHAVTYFTHSHFHAIDRIPMRVRDDNTLFSQCVLNVNESKQICILYVMKNNIYNYLF